MLKSFDLFTSLMYQRFRRITIAIYWPLLLGIVSRIASFSLFILYQEEIFPKSKYLGNFLFALYTLPAPLFLTFFLSNSLLLLKIYKRVKSNNKEVTQYKTTIKMLNMNIYTVILIMVILEFTLSPNEKASVDIPNSPSQIFKCLLHLKLLYNDETINYDGCFDANATSEFKKKYYIIAFIVLEIIPILLLLNITNGLHEYAGTLGKIDETTKLINK
ncbi:hypothetical protein ACTFIY_010204 [Dictyostelium cf. discoideum]